MSPPKKMEFQGKDVAEAIAKACEALNASQEDLEIEVLHTGSPGVFGLCRRPARLRVARKAEDQEKAASPRPKGQSRKKSAKEAGPRAEKPEIKPAKVAETVEKVETEATVAEVAPKPATPAAAEERPTKKEKPSKSAAGEKIARKTKQQKGESPDREKEVPAGKKSIQEVSPLTGEEGDAAVEQVRNDLGRVLDLMGLSSEVAVSLENHTVVAHVKGDHVDDIVGPEGRTLDSLQYLLRKMLSRNFSEKIMLNLDAGDFRANRMQELEALAHKLAAEVKESGKTGSIPALNPSERRIVHMALQADKEIRSRSVGEGLFKKVLIYKPGSKTRKGGGRKRRGPRPAQAEGKNGKSQ